MNLTQVKGNTWVLEGIQLIPLYKLDDRRCILLDTGLLEERPMPEDIDYLSIEGLRLEARQKLDAIRPRNLGQAGRVSGVSPADVAVLMVYLKQNET